MRACTGVHHTGAGMPARSKPSAAAPGAPALARVRRGFGLTREGFRRLSGFSVRVQADWEKGVRRPNEQASVRLSELERLHEALTRVIKPESLAAWLDTPNPAFDGLKPIEVVERGQTDRLWRMVFELESGSPG